ncbi:hypothetical protein EVG20_g6393 [Dentipellis fragilis]|uniref:F-box domain-containing protein n=1 Tax=Dentipellis fragilis TaxID=205917 RepID=A0A4Y9YP05_9AGAM|nr:hypothetical protein EVG20_g6393 [Dentipellis fragilis]
MSSKLDAFSFLRNKRRPANQELQDTSLFTRQPVEILIIILQKLDSRSLLRLSITCKLLHTLTKTVPELQYVIVLAAEGGVNESSDMPPTVNERLRDILNRRDRWRTLDWRKHHSMRVPATNSVSFLDPNNFITFTQGAFITTMYNQHHYISSVIVTWLPVRGEATRSLVIDNFNLPKDILLDNYIPPPPHDLDTDPVQQASVHPHLDLVILLKVSRRGTRQVLFDLHLRSLKSAARWPLIRVLGDLVALHVCHNGDGNISVWNWVTGDKIAEFTDKFLDKRLYDLAFISLNTLIATVSVGTFDRETRTARSAMIWVYDLKATQANAQPAILCLPTFGNGDISVSSFKCSFDKPTASPFSNEDSCAAPRPVVFGLSTMSPGKAANSGRALTFMVVRSDAFTTCLRVSSPRSSSSAVILPWEEWGPGYTRVFEPNWSRWAHWGNTGNGCIVSPEEIPFRKGPLKILDFLVGRYKPQELVVKPSMIRSSIFKHSVASSLPYRVIPIHGIQRSGNFVLDENYFVRYAATSSPDSMVDVDVLEL